MPLPREDLGVLHPRVLGILLPSAPSAPSPGRAELGKFNGAISWPRARTAAHQKRSAPLTLPGHGGKSCTGRLVN